MALDAETITAACKGAVLGQLATMQTPFESVEEIQDAVADVIACIVPIIILAIKTSADVTGVTAGVNTVSGGID